MTPPRRWGVAAPAHERRVFEGQVIEWHDGRTGADHSMLRGERGAIGVDLDAVTKGFHGKRVRITVEVLDSPPPEKSEEQP